MNINATLIIQAVNFFIAYLLLRTLLFKPTVTAIDVDCAQQQVMQDFIVHAQQIINQQEQERQRMWYTCQQFFLLNTPVVRDPALVLFRHIMPALTYSPVTTAAIDALTDITAHAIVTKVVDYDA